MTLFLGAINVILYAVMAIGLIIKCRHNRDWGLIWLTIPLVLLPAIAIPIAYWQETAVDQLAARQPAGAYPFTLVERGQLTLGQALTLSNFLQHTVWGAFGVLGVSTLYRRAAEPEPVEGCRHQAR